MGRRSSAVSTVEQPAARPSEPLLPPPQRSGDEPDEVAMLLASLRQSSPSFRSNITGLYAAWEASQEDDDREPWPSTSPPPQEVPVPAVPRPPTLPVFPSPVLEDHGEDCAAEATDDDADDFDDEDASPTRTGCFRRRGGGRGRAEPRERLGAGDAGGRDSEALLRRIARR